MQVTEDDETDLGKLIINFEYIETSIQTHGVLRGKASRHSKDLTVNSAHDLIPH